jgi:hypothetical protein
MKGWVFEVKNAVCQLVELQFTDMSNMMRTRRIVVLATSPA